jgi:zinc/manganese transport system substrate-binding protein
MRLRRLLGAAAAVALLAMPAGAQAAVKAFACVPEWAELLRVIGGDAVEVTLATTATENPETVHPTPQMIAALGEADLLVCTGAGLEEEWLPSLLERAPNPKIAVDQPGYFMASTAVTLMGFADPGHDDGKTHHHAGNPHIQGDPRNIIKVAGQLARRLSDLDPDNAQLYGDNARAFIRDMSSLVKELEAEAAPLKGVNIVVQHESSLYLLTWLGMHDAATVEEAPEVPPGPAHLAEVIGKVPQDNMKFVLYAPFDDPGGASFIAEKAGIPLVKWPFTVGGTADSSTFPDFYRSAVGRLLDGLDGVSRTD